MFLLSSMKELYPKKLAIFPQWCKIQYFKCLASLEKVINEMILKANLHHVFCLSFTFKYWFNKVMWFYHGILCPSIIFYHFILYFSTLTFPYPNSLTIPSHPSFFLWISLHEQGKNMQCLTFWVWLISPTI